MAGHEGKAVVGDVRPLSGYDAGPMVAARHLACAVALSCLTAWWLTGCDNPPVASPGPRPAPPAPVDPGQEVVSEGSASVTVLSRPDHPLARPKEKAPKQMTDALCRAEAACGKSGACTAAGQTCVAASYADCEQMPACALGKCVYEASTCRVVASCREAHGCKERGACGEVDGKCVPADAEGCAQSAKCKREGMCTFHDDICMAATAKDCRDAEVCLQGGQCIADGGLCKALEDAQCKRAPACKEGGKCLARDGVCVTSCADDTNCKRFGRCEEKKTAQGISCVALSTAGCRAAEICADLGMCTAGLDGQCKAGDDVECRRARTCKEDGRCSAVNGRCQPKSDAECAQSSVACGREKRCRHRASRCVP